MNIINNIQTGPNSDNSYTVTKYNFSCAGKNCKNTPTYYLRLKLIKRQGWFCESCRQYLQKEGLVEYIINTVDGGENNFGRLQ